LLSAKNILFGLFNRYGKVPYAFPVIIIISDLRMLSDAIIYRAK
jgi:hypothetical protein